MSEQTFTDLPFSHFASDGTSILLSFSFSFLFPLLLFISPCFFHVSFSDACLCASVWDVLLSLGLLWWQILSPRKTKTLFSLCCFPSIRSLIIKWVTDTGIQDKRDRKKKVRKNCSVISKSDLRIVRVWKYYRQCEMLRVINKPLQKFMFRHWTCSSSLKLCYFPCKVSMLRAVEMTRQTGTHFPNI